MDGGTWTTIVELQLRSDGVAAALISSVVPYMLKTDPDGTPPNGIDG
ncbi:hypothetical protein [Rhizobium mongolense]|uniref:Uncharacterized protein n=1 Tax=Rhizobium mongolense TaxID=57676 RepID=A0A7W6WBT4_9HYPH|nr:hypothetical protein [Rhizobium mongolense]MBB4272286.1 hypothetical protein [Rhizobium mongolense]